MSERHFWNVHMVGAYEWKPGLDNDPNSEAWMAGWSEHQNANDPTNFVFTETVRDLWAEPQMPGMVDVATGLDRVSAHEALHRFFGWHLDPNDENFPGPADEGIMSPTVLMTQASIDLTNRQIRVVQEKDHPK